MYRGEIFAYPLFLQKELQAATDVHFYCTDIACKYWPYLQKVVTSLPELGSLLQMSPFLSVMHAKAHSTKCEVCHVFYSHIIEPLILYINNNYVYVLHCVRLCGVGGIRRVQVRQLGRKLRWWTATFPVVPSPQNTWPSLVCSTGYFQHHELLFILFLVWYQKKETILLSYYETIHYYM